MQRKFSLLPQIYFQTLLETERDGSLRYVSGSGTVELNENCRIVRPLRRRF